MRARLLSGVADQRAFSLIETMVAGVLLTIVIGAVLTLSDAAQRVVPREEALAFSIKDSQVALERMTRELRQAYVLHATTATHMEVSARIRGVTRRVVFDCNEPHPEIDGLKQCVRYLITGSTPGPKATIVPQVVNATFTYEPTVGPRYARLKVNVPASGDRREGYEHDVFFDDGFYMRNLDNG